MNDFISKELNVRGPSSYELTSDVIDVILKIRNLRVELEKLDEEIIECNKRIAHDRT